MPNGNVAGNKHSHLIRRPNVSPISKPNLSEGFSRHVLGRGETTERSAQLLSS